MRAGREQNAIFALHSRYGHEMHPGKAPHTLQLRPCFSAIGAHENPAGSPVLAFHRNEPVARAGYRTNGSIDKPVVRQADLLAAVFAFSNAIVLQREIDMAGI